MDMTSLANNFLISNPVINIFESLSAFQITPWRQFVNNGVTGEGQMLRPVN